MAFLPNEIVHDRLTREAFTIVSCGGGVAVLSDGSVRMIGDLTRPGRRAVLPAGECAYCDENRSASMFPRHDASERCESGKHAHCTCDTCF